MCDICGCGVGKLRPRLAASEGRQYAYLWALVEDDAGARATTFRRTGRGIWRASSTPNDRPSVIRTREVFWRSIFPRT